MILEDDGKNQRVLCCSGLRSSLMSMLSFIVGLVSGGGWLLSG
jgi:hypothetical protein